MQRGCKPRSGSVCLRCASRGSQSLVLINYSIIIIGFFSLHASPVDPAMRTSLYTEIRVSHCSEELFRGRKLRWRALSRYPTGRYSDREARDEVATKNRRFDPTRRHLSAMDNETRYNLITRGLQEVIGGEIVQQILADGRTPKCYWGTAPTGRRMGMACGMQSNLLILFNSPYCILRGPFKNCRFPSSRSRGESVPVLETPFDITAL